MAVRSSRGVTSGRGTPQRLEGRNGDITIRSTPSGKKLFVKDKNIWHSINLDVDTTSMKNSISSMSKDVEQARKKRNFIIADNVSLRALGKQNASLKNDNGSIIATVDDSATSSRAFKIVRDVNDGNPTFQMGSADTESFYITAGYAGGGKGLDYVNFETKTAQTSGNEGQMRFKVDEVTIMNLNDTGTILYTPGSVTNDTAALTLENNASNSSMTGTGTAILFNQMYHHAETPTIVDAGKIVVRTEGNWTSTGTTQDSEMTFHTVENGSQSERLKIGSNGTHTITSQANPQLKILYNADDYATFTVADTGDLTIATVGDGTTDSDLTLDIDGDIELNADGGNISFNDNLAPLASLSEGRINIFHDATSYCRIDVTDAGVTQISTVDGTLTDADLIVDAGGDITLDSGTGKFIAKNAGTEFSVANSAYAGMLIGYSYFRNTDAVSGDDLITIGTTMTVLQTTNGNDVAITFKAPPSGNVEIIFSAMVYGVSKEVMFALSDNATFNELNQIHTYDAWSHRMDETDQNQVYIPFVLTGLTPGSSYTYYIAADSSGASAYIYHGSTRTNTHSPPITIKAIALPATITTGT